MLGPGTPGHYTQAAGHHIKPVQVVLRLRSVLEMRRSVLASDDCH